eukprot:Gb_02840 [translate_table: standard]
MSTREMVGVVSLFKPSSLATVPTDNYKRKMFNYGIPPKYSMQELLTKYRASPLKRKPGSVSENEICTKIYQNFKSTVSYFFDNSSGNDIHLAASQHTLGFIGSQRPPGGPIPGQLNPSTCSFKIVTECPLIVMFIFQLYSCYVQTNVPVLLPLMVNAISIPGPQHVPLNLKYHFVELKGAQVKLAVPSGPSLPHIL